MTTQCKTPVSVIGRESHEEKSVRPVASIQRTHTHTHTLQCALAVANTQNLIFYVNNVLTPNIHSLKVPKT